MTLAAARAELGVNDGRRGKGWQGLDRAAAQPGFDRRIEQEFPAHAGEWVDPVSRRGFMKLMGASMAMAGLAGCTKQPDEPIYPYVKAPEDLILGKPNYFATAMPFNTGAIPLLVKSDAYRPIKVDGNPEHPMSLGGSDTLSQGSLLSLYDPDRSQHVLYHLETSSFVNFQSALLHDLANMPGGQGLYILSSTITSPTLAAQWKDAQKRLPQAKLIQYDPVNRDSARRASKAAFGDFYDAQYKLENADVILSLDSDFLSGITHPGFTKLSREYAKRRKLTRSVHRDEPAVCGREHADNDRLQGRAPAEGEGQPGGSGRSCHQRGRHTGAKLDRRAAGFHRRGSRRPEGACGQVRGDPG